jgi:hypothetical protein
MSANIMFAEKGLWPCGTWWLLDGLKSRKETGDIATAGSSATDSAAYKMRRIGCDFPTRE